MVSERVKLYVYDFLRIFTCFLYPYYRVKYAKTKNIKMVLGSGPYYAENWVNLEANPVYRKDIFYDFRNSLPFTDGSVQAVYSAHVFEHLYMNELAHVLQECFRLMASGSVLRICLPCLRKNAEAYLKQDEKFFQWEPEELNPFKDYTAAAKFSRNVLVDGAHKNMYDFESFSRVLETAGFKNIQQKNYRSSGFLSAEDLRAIEPEELQYRSWNSFFAEAVKP